MVKSGVSDQDAVHVYDLAKTLGKKGHHHEIIRNLQAIRKKVQVLPKPLEKPAADRVRTTLLCQIFINNMYINMFKYSYCYLYFR